jgi:hypothetical protein
VKIIGKAATKVYVWAYRQYLRVLLWIEFGPGI